MESGSDVVAINELGFAEANLRRVCCIIRLDWDVDSFEPFELLKFVIILIVLIVFIVCVV